jgi:hypothetical protein
MQNRRPWCCCRLSFGYLPNAFDAYDLLFESEKKMDEEEETGG